MRNPLAWLTRRSVPPPSPPWDVLWTGPTVAGMTVDATTATKVPAVFACLSVLTQDLARCPVRLKRKVDADTYEDAVDHPLWEVLHDLANPDMTAYQFKAAMEWNLLVHG